MAKMTMKGFEKSATDRKMDARKGAPKEGSKADRKIDKAALAKMNKSRGAKRG